MIGYLRSSHRKICEFLTGRFFGLEASVFVAAIAKRFVFRLTTATEIDRGQLVFRKLFTLVIEYLRAAAHFIRTVFQHADNYIGHDFLLPIPEVSNAKAEHRIVDGTLQRLLISGSFAALP